VDANKEAIDRETAEGAGAETAENLPVVEAAEQPSGTAGNVEQQAELPVSRKPERRKPAASVRRPESSAAPKRSGSGRKRVLVGRVVSDKMQKTIVVQIERRKLHPLYKKYITRTKKIKAHDESNECTVGDLVRVMESRPMSKDKHWRLVEILEKAK
jgi:small subunit ribosomal protein S17